VWRILTIFGLSNGLKSPFKWSDWSAVYLASGSWSFVCEKTKMGSFGEISFF
jgi:hypothetical protein